VLTAITATAIGFAFDAGSGSKELSAVFAGCYVLGCLGAVLAVRQAALFTAVIQPPLILFGAVPAAYFLFTSGQNNGLKDLAINCGYPLIERFPLMFFTSAAVLLIGMFRWYHGMTARRGVPHSTQDDEPKTSVASALTAKMSSLFARDTDDDEDEVPEPPRRRRSSETRSTRTSRTTSARGKRDRPTRRSTPSRSRHVRPPDTEIIEPVAERPRRTRSSRQEPPTSGEPRRRPRPPRQSGPPPSEHRTGYDRAERRRRFDDYDFDFQPREPHGRNGTNGTNGSSNGTGTHHPISRVRYRGEEAEDRAEYRSRRRTTRERDADTWQYDV
jgi:hypothetical protein